MIIHRRLKEIFLFVEGIQQTKFDSVMSINATAGNDPMRQQRVTCYKCDQKVHYRKDCPNLTGTNQVPD